jgi:hypothetical protein
MKKLRKILIGDRSREERERTRDRENRKKQ